MDEIVLKDLPQLIVGLDSDKDDSNYVHIEDVKDNTDYYCPCCKGIIRPRAYKKEESYKVQPHFYHLTGGCSEESYIHYICKTWLFEKGCKFNVNNVMYTVDNIETEKTYRTSFGDYRPDITVITEENKTFFFEIKYTSKKSEVYAPKWDELGLDVIEVDVREFINNKHTNEVPKFNLIYSEGECFVKSYTLKEYDDVIANRKLEWKRQDKINYKIQWEKLDWFWDKLCKFKIKEIDFNGLMYYFNNLDLSDQEICYDLVKKMNCFKLYRDELRKVLNDNIINYLSENINELCGTNETKIKFRSRSYIYIKFKYNGFYFGRQLENKETILRYSSVVKLLNNIKSMIKNIINVNLWFLKYENILKNSRIWILKSYNKAYNKKIGWGLSQEIKIIIKDDNQHICGCEKEIISYEPERRWYDKNKIENEKEITEECFFEILCEGMRTVINHINKNDSCVKDHDKKRRFFI